MTNLLKIYQQNEGYWDENISKILRTREAAEYLDQDVGEDIGFDYSRKITDELNYDFTTDDYTGELKNSTDEDVEDLLLDDRRVILEYLEVVKEAYFKIASIAQYHYEINSNLSDFF